MDDTTFYAFSAIAGWIAAAAVYAWHKKVSLAEGEQWLDNLLDYVRGQDYTPEEHKEWLARQTREFKDWLQRQKQREYEDPPT